MLKIRNRQIERVLIIDDDPGARDSYEYLINDMDLIPSKIENIRNGDLENFFDSIEPTDAILCDFHLKKHSYAPYNGDRIVSQC